ncbi:GNAT family protein [Streptomyces sp. PmtG]
MAVSKKDGGRAISFIRLVHAGDHGEEIGCAIAADEWGHGYSTDAHRVIRDFAFQQPGVQRVCGWIPLDNERRIKAFDEHGAVGGLGFATDEIRRDHVFINGAWRDCNLNSVSAQEWSRRRESLVARPEPDEASGGQ